MLAKNYDLACLAFRTFAQRSRCASAILRRASLLRLRLVPSLFPPPALPRSVQRFPYTRHLFLKTGVFRCREVTTLFRFAIRTP